MLKLSARQGIILDFLREQGAGSNRAIKEYIGEKLEQVNRITVVRDLDQLLEAGLVVKVGEGRGTSYELVDDHSLLVAFDADDYFRQPPDKREIRDRFNFDVFDYFEGDILTAQERGELGKINDQYRERLPQLSPTLLKKEFERLTVELSWKSSQIEGNTYSLIDTEILIKEHIEAEGHSKEEARMILNHKDALDYILDRRSDFKTISRGKIEDLHKIVTKDLGIASNIRHSLVGVTGTAYRPLDNEFQIKEALDAMARLLNDGQRNPLARAMIAVLLTSYIQPFEDGNKRTARLLGNAVLLAHEYCPLSYRSVDEGDYKRAMILFYEQNSAHFFKELFIEQFKFAASNYFLV